MSIILTARNGHTTDLTKPLRRDCDGWHLLTEARALRPLGIEERHAGGTTWADIWFHPGTATPGIYYLGPVMGPSEQLVPPYRPRYATLAEAGQRALCGADDDWTYQVEVTA